jgi:hypothetical protein
MSAMPSWKSTPQQLPREPEHPHAATRQPYGMQPLLGWRGGPGGHMVGVQAATPLTLSGPMIGRSSATPAHSVRVESAWQCVMYLDGPKVVGDGGSGTGSCVLQDSGSLGAGAHTRQAVLGTSSNGWHRNDSEVCEQRAKCPLPPGGKALLELKTS